MISKELLREVLGVDVQEFDAEKSCEQVYNGFDISYNYNKTISAYELAYKCKKWAYTKYQILLDSRVTTAGSCFLTYSPFSGTEHNKKFVDDTEYIAVFKACQWILDNIANKGIEKVNKIEELPAECICDSGGVDNTTGKCITCGLPYLKDSMYALSENLLGLKEKHSTGNYICAAVHYMSNKTDYEIITDLFGLYSNHVLIHNKDKHILEAYLADKSVEIVVDDTRGWVIVKSFIDTYNENNTYKLIPQMQYPIYKRNIAGEVFRIDNRHTAVCLLSDNTTYVIGQTYTNNKEVIGETETILFDQEFGLYHQQPIWCWDNDAPVRIISLFSDTNGSFDLWDNVEAISSEQLKALPFVWGMYISD